MVEDEGLESPAAGAAAPVVWLGGGRRGGRAGSVRWSLALARTICERVAQGETLYAVLRSPGMPSYQSVRMWAGRRPDFAQALQAARVAGGRPARGGGGVFSYCEETAQAIFQRLCEGQSLTAICEDATMPTISTVYYWRNRLPDFARTLQTAREIQAERFCERGWALAEAATPETAYLTHVRLTQLRWMAGRMAPKTYHIRQVEPAAAAKPPVDVLMRRFEIETDPATGKDKVVAYCPNPETGEVEREDVPGWRPPPGVLIPNGVRGPR